MQGQTILIFGKHGQVGTELTRVTWPEGTTLVRLDVEDIDLSTAHADDILAIIQHASADIVINATAYTAVDKAETAHALADALNATAPGAMAEACAAADIPFLHISTDYVFDGTKDGAYVEDDPVNPQSAYGRTKEAGEQAVRAATDKHIIMRTAWVYSAHGGNFIKTMLRLGAERDEVSVVHDQKGCPTSAAEIASALAHMAQHALNAPDPAFGTYHYAGSEAMSWYDFARAIFEESAKLGAKTPKMLWPIGTKEYPTPAVRPANSVLDRSKALATFGLTPPSFREALRACLSELLAESKD